MSNANELKKTLDRVANHLAIRNVTLACTLKSRASSDDVREAENRLGLALPESYVDFVMSFADGFVVSWFIEDGPFGFAEMTTMSSSIDGILGMREWRIFDDDSARKYGFPYVDDSELALVTNKLMRNWIPFHAEANGDYFSIDLNSNGSGRVIFDKHDWLDGGTGHNGFLMADNLFSFFNSWGNICFSQPKTLWWPSVIVEDRVDWLSDEFDDEFRLKDC
ncbi:MAG: SMI1/KNR4 family protein [Pirellulaceae bacterium]|nr:SMI1/KNR4 family protein [Pirellulaceae bacterium]